LPLSIEDTRMVKGRSIVQFLERPV